MKAERLFRALGLIDPALAEEALETRQRAIPWRRWGALAACLALVCVLGWGVGSGMLGGYGGGMSGGADSGSAGAGSGVENGIAFMYYDGPALPLTTVEDCDGLTAEREVAWNFAPGAYPDGEPRQWGAEVTDAYVLSNPTGADITVTALYPFAGSLYDINLQGLPEVAVDGAAAETTLYAGSASGGFESAAGINIPYYTADLSRLSGWEEYKILLESGEYLEWALGEAPVLDMPVTVYEFSDFQAPHDQYPAATQAMSFHMDPEKTRIFTYGINGREQDGTFFRYSYFVPDGVRREPERKLLAVLGEDIGEYALQGYQDGGCERGEEIGGVSCTVTRSETTLDALLDQAAAYGMEFYRQDGGFGLVSPELYRRAAGELLYQYSLFSGAPVDRFCEGRLDDVFSETWMQDRVLYLAFPVTVPAGGSVNVSCGLRKMPSFDYGCSGSENAGLQGYDLVTQLGSGLKFTVQRAVLENTGNVELTGQNFGFDLENGITAVDLDLECEHYYMELRVK